MARIAAFLNRHSRWIVVTGAIFAVIAIVAIGVPIGARFALVDWLRDHGAQQASIDRVVADYFHSRITITGLRVEDKTGKVLRLDRVTGSYDLAGLWHHRLHLRSLALDGGTIEFVQEDNGQVRVAGIPAGPVSSENPTEPSPWLIGIDTTAIDGLNIRLHTPDGSQEFTIEKAKLGALAMWADEAPTALELALAIGNGSLQVGGRATPLGSAHSFALDLDIKAFDMARAAIFRGVGQVSGIFAGKLKLTAEFPKDKGPEIHLSGTASLEGLKLEDEPDQPSLGTLAWTGEASLASKPGGAIGVELKGKLDLEKMAYGNTSIASAAFTDLDARATYDASSGVVADIDGTLAAGGVRSDLGDTKAAAGSLRWTGTIHATSGADGSFDVATKGDLQATAASYAAPAAQMRGDRLQWSGTIKAASTASDGINLAADGALEADAPRYAAAGTQIASERLRWKGTVTAVSAADRSLKLDSDGQLDATGPSYAATAAQIRSNRFQWHGALNATSSAGGAYAARAKGDLSADAPSYGAQAAASAAAGPTGASFGRIAYTGLDAKVSAPTGAPMTVEVGGTLSADAAKVSVGDDNFADDSIIWNGTVNVTAPPGGAAALALDGTMDSKGLALELASLGYKAAQQALHWQGTAKMDPDGTPTMNASATLSGTTVDSPKENLRLLDAGKLALDGAALDSRGRITVQRVAIDALRGFGPPGATEASAFIAAIGTLAANGVAFDPGKRIAARSVKIGNAEVDIERDEKGKLRLTGLLSALGGEDKGDGTSAPSPRIVVGDLTLDGKSRIDFVDRSVDPPAKIAMGPIKLHLGALDSDNPKRPTPVDLHAELGRYSVLDLEGTAQPFADRINVDVDGKLTGFELTSLSGYLSQYLGYNLSRGRLDTEVNVKIVDGVLDSGSEIKVTNLSVAAEDNEASRALQKSLQISLDTALSLLRSSDDVIRLNVPVTGDLASPNFDLSDAINTAIGNAMKRTVTTLLTVAFPVGGLIMAIVDASGDKALTFKPIGFAGGEVELGANARDYLDTLAKLLKARPAVKITACGIATPQDAADIFRVRKQKAEALTREQARRGDMLPKEEPVPVTRDDLYDLSHRRSEAVKDYLVGHEKVDESRVFICAPNVSDDPKAPPHAEITL